MPVQCDVTDKQSLVAAAQRIKDEAGFVNVVIANSGITGPQLQDLPQDASVEQFQQFMWNMDMQQFTDTYNLNVTAVFLTLVAFMLLLDAGNKAPESPTTSTGIKSQFITTSSIAAFNRKATAGFAYGTSKAAVTHLMKQMSGYLGPFHIRANVICPGMYPSDMHSVSWLAQAQSPKWRDWRYWWRHNGI